MVLLLGKAPCLTHRYYTSLKKTDRGQFHQPFWYQSAESFVRIIFLHFLWQKHLAKLRQNMALSADDVTKLCNKISEQMLVKYKSTFCAICFKLAPLHIAQTEPNAIKDYSPVNTAVFLSLQRNSCKYRKYIFVTFILKTT
jgi:hypothetical protein